MAIWAWDKVAGLNVVCLGRAWAGYMYYMWCILGDVQRAPICDFLFQMGWEIHDSVDGTGMYGA